MTLFGAGYLGEENTRAALLLALLSLSIFAWAVNILLLISVSWSRLSATLNKTIKLLLCSILFVYVRVNDY